ncbi:MAG TPA: hypothetical protein VE863_15440, partial [Pyrinomonadaceae bacterium]|nr:hypothetical protein [Pyrinomonadaceae bacterium]
KSHTVVSILESEPPPLTTFAPDTPTELQRIVRKALTKDRDNRYQTARDLMIDLKNLRRDLDLKSELERSAKTTPFSDSSASATVASTDARKLEITEIEKPRHTSVPAENQNWIRQHKGLVATAAALLIVALLLIGWRAFSSSQPTAAQIDSIAVLPFVNDRIDPNAEYLADGIPESIIDTLSQLSELKVMSRNSVFKYKGQEADAQAVGRELKVAAVLTGHVAQQAGNFWIRVELVNTRDGTQIWGNQYNQPITELFTTQADIARQVSEKLRLKLTAPEQQQMAHRYTDNVKAFEYYTQGRSHLGLRTHEELLTAIDYYHKAIGEDRNYALAYAGLAEVYANLGGRGYLSPAEARRQAEAAAQKALLLDSNLAEGYLAIGEISVLFAPFDFERADRALQRAVDLSPNLASVHQYLGNSYVLRARYDDALREFHKARELDPLSSILARLVAGPYYYRHDYARAMDLLQQANELRPSYLTLWEVGVYIQNKKFDYAWSELEKEKQQRKNDAILLESEGQLYAAQGRRAEALQVIKQLEAISGADSTQAQYIGGIYVLLGDKEQAFAWLERGLDANAIFFFIKDDPLWDPVRNDPRFAAALKRMGLPT